MVGGGDRPNLMLAQVQDFCPGPGPGQDLTGTWPGLDLEWDLEWDLDLSLTINMETSRIGKPESRSQSKVQGPNQKKERKIWIFGSL